MNNYRKHLRAALISALGYGLGFVFGVMFIKLVLDLGFLESIANFFENQRLFIGLLILFSVVVLGGVLAGAVGGLLLSYATGSEDRKRTITRSTLGIGAGFGIVLLPIMGLVAMLAMYNAGGASPVGFVISMGIVGAIFGLVAGLMTGTLPAKINYWRTAGVATLAFGLGGIAFGFGLWHYFYTLYASGAALFELLLAFFMFGGVGGLVLGWIFSLDRELAGGEQAFVQANVIYRAVQWFKTTKFYRKRGFWGTLLFVAVLFILTRLLAMSPLSMSASQISDYLPADTKGVHWSAPWGLSEAATTVKHPSVAQAEDLVAVAWEQAGDIYLSTSTTEGDHMRVWRPAVNLSGSPNTDSLAPQVAVDTQGRIHLVWSESVASQAGAFAILYRACLEGECTEPAVISNPNIEGCGSETNLTPAIAIDSSEIMVVWSSQTDNLPYATWPIGDPPQNASSGCALAEEVAGVANPRLAAHPEGGFFLVFDNGTEILVAATDAESGAFSLIYQEAGNTPEILIDSSGVIHAAWCGLDGQINYRGEGSLTKTIPDSNCLTRPTLGQNANGVIHLLWYANQAEQPSGKRIETNLIYQSRLISGVWSDPTIIGLSAEMAQPTVATGSDGQLHLAWEGLTAEASQVNYANYQVYECSETGLNRQDQLALEVAQSGVYRPVNDVVPYCWNQFDQLLILPMADPAFSDLPPTQNGAFDQISDLIQTAHYEVLLSTMWYEANETPTSPGDVLARGIKDLYDQVKAHPEQYPRGMTIRILLDNPPEFTLSNLISQVWNVFKHLRDAGVPTMSDPDIGWNLEVANYAGSWPHGHTKMVVIDGKTAIAAGFNFQSKHLSTDHPSGKGGAQYDLGIQISGPVAQSTQLAFDDLWHGSNRINCPDLSSDSPLWWLSCRREIATAEHVPEVEKYYLAPENHNAFALHRTQKFNESDVTVAKVIASAQETLDIIQVNFTLKMICDLNVLFKVCDFSDALSYMNAMLDAIEANQVQTRVLIKVGPIESVESNIAVEAFRQVLEARGLSDLVEFRYFNGNTHAKNVLIDNQFLIVGSQNFHYSAWGNGSGLTEFNIGTDDPNAIKEFQRFFNYHWVQGRSIPEE